MPLSMRDLEPQVPVPASPSRAAHLSEARLPGPAGCSCRGPLDHSVPPARALLGDSRLVVLFILQVLGRPLSLLHDLEQVMTPL